MKISCGWCSKDMGAKEPLDDPQITTGICESCLELLRLETRRYWKNELKREEGESDAVKSLRKEPSVDCLCDE